MFATTAFGDMVNSALVGGMTPEEAFDEHEPTLKDAFDQTKETLNS
jgi:ABC-type glycerol-3-phosphate transport system substrate-binding protein